MITDHVMKMENVRTPQDHFHVPAMLDIQEMGIPAKVRYMHCFVYIVFDGCVSIDVENCVKARGL